MPTLPMKATPMPPQNAPLALWCQRAFEMLPNTCPFDVTGHPAMSMPCGMSHGLPIGMMLVGEALQRVDDLPRRPRVRAARATGATSKTVEPRRHGEHGEGARQDLEGTSVGP